MFKNVDLNSATYFGTLFKKSEIPRRSKKTIPKIGDQMGQRALSIMKYRYCNRILDNMRKVFWCISCSLGRAIPVLLESHSSCSLVIW